MGGVQSASRRRVSSVPTSSAPTPDANSWYVSPTGNDGAAGTLGAPFLTLGKAFTEAGISGTRKTIFLRGGRYQLSSHIYLDSSKANISVHAYPDETPVISGGQVVTGFASEGGNIYSATVTPATSLDLAIGGERQRCAQTGVFDPADPYRSGWLMADSVATGSETTTQFKYRGTDLSSVTVATGMMAYVLEGGFLRATSVDILQPVSSINTSTKVVTLAAATSGAAPIYTDSSYKLLNHPSFIRNDGEFAWRQSDGKLVVRPKVSNFESLGVVVPRAQYLFQIDAGADNITFGDITFSDVPYGGAVFYIYGGAGTRIGGCTFNNVGTGVLLAGVQNTVIGGNTFNSIADAAVVLWQNTKGTKIYANTFTDIGLIRKGGAAVSSIEASNSTVVYNDVTGSSRYGMSFKGVAPTGHVFNICSRNRVIETNRETPDTGAIEFLNRDRANLNATVSGNYIDNTGGFTLTSTGAYENRKYSSGVYLDDLSSNVTVSKNFIRGAAWGHVFIHGGDSNLIENNVMVIEPHETLVFTMHNNGNLTGDVLPDNNTFQKNIIYSATSRTGTLWNVQSLGTGNVINNNILYNIPKLAGFDSTGIIADPLFKNPAAEDFTLQTTSPAYTKGFTDLEYNKMGIRGYVAASATAESLPRFWKRSEQAGQTQLPSNFSDEFSVDFY